MTVQDLYNQAIRQLPAVDRLTLAKMILDDIPPQSVVDYNEQWSEEDLTQFSEAGWRRGEDLREGAKDA